MGNRCCRSKPIDSSGLSVPLCVMLRSPILGSPLEDVIPLCRYSYMHPRTAITSPLLSLRTYMPSSLLPEARNPTFPWPGSPVVFPDDIRTARRGRDLAVFVVVSLIMELRRKHCLSVTTLTEIVAFTVSRQGYYRCPSRRSFRLISASAVVN